MAGDFFVGLKLAQGLILADSLRWKEGVFVLIDNVTFSAAMSNATQFVRILNARLIGEPTGAKPSGFQDMGSFTLPHSKLEVTYSKRFYRFSDKETNTLQPDVELLHSIENYRNGTDSQLDWIVSKLIKRGRTVELIYHR